MFSAAYRAAQASTEARDVVQLPNEAFTEARDALREVVRQMMRPEQQHPSWREFTRPQLHQLIRAAEFPNRCIAYALIALCPFIAEDPNLWGPLVYIDGPRTYRSVINGLDDLVRLQPVPYRNLSPPLPAGKYLLHTGSDNGTGVGHCTAVVWEGHSVTAIEAGRHGNPVLTPIDTFQYRYSWTFMRVVTDSAEFSSIIPPARRDPRDRFAGMQSDPSQSESLGSQDTLPGQSPVRRAATSSGSAGPAAAVAPTISADVQALVVARRDIRAGSAVRPKTG